MWNKLKNLFKKKPKTTGEKIKTLEQVFKKIPKKANETAEESRKRIKVNKRINEASA
jgi:ferritin-like metal-binding protein YciE